MEPSDSSVTPVPDMLSTSESPMYADSSEAPAKESNEKSTTAAAMGEKVSGAEDDSGSTTTGSPNERLRGDGGGGNPVPGGEKVDSDITNGTPASRTDALDGELLKGTIRK